MLKADYIPADYDRIRVAKTLKTFFDMSLGRNVDCIVLRRTIKGDFDGLAAKLAQSDGLEKISGPIQLYKIPFIKQYSKIALSLSPGEDQALDRIMRDMSEAEKHGYLPCIRILKPDCYSKQVYRFHKDGFRPGDENVALGERLMCSYNRAATEILREDGIADSVVREDTGVTEFIPKPDAKPIQFACGDLFRQAYPCLTHRAPNVPGIRLTLVG